MREVMKRYWWVSGANSPGIDPGATLPKQPELRRLGASSVENKQIINGFKLFCLGDEELLILRSVYQKDGSIRSGLSTKKLARTHVGCDDLGTVVWACPAVSPFKQESIATVLQDAVASSYSVGVRAFLRVGRRQN